MKFPKSALVSLVAALFVVPGVLSQGPPPGGGGPGGFQMSPDMMAKFKAWQTWRKNHPHVQSLQQTIGGLGEIERDPRTKLNASQAKMVLATMNKWRTKPTLSDAQALTVTKELTTPLTVTQLKKLATAGPRRRGGGGGPGGGGGGPRPGGFGGGRGPGGGGPGGGGRGPGGFTMPAPKDYNPLNANTIPFERMRPRMAKEINTLIMTLKATK